jgi:hypothetical protein
MEPNQVIEYTSARENSENLSEIWKDLPTLWNLMVSWNQKGQKKAELMGWIFSNFLIFLYNIMVV